VTFAEFEFAPGVTCGSGSFPVVAGPCVIESEEMVLAAATQVESMSQRVGIPLVFKASYDKANRSSIRGFRGPGLEEGLRILANVKAQCGLPILTDVHEPAHCEPAAEVCAVLQIPAFLCRQTDLILAAASTGRSINIKKGQFMAPDDMRRVVEKARSAGARQVTVTERGTSFGYRNLIVDMRSFSILHRDEIPVIYDLTHSLQLPGARAEGSGGEREFAEPLAYAAVAAGADGLYLEVHPSPEDALSDSATQLPFDRAERLLRGLVELRRVMSPERGEDSR